MRHIGNSPKLPSTDWVPLQEPNQINRMSDWQIDFRQLESGRMQSAIRLCAGRSVKLIELRMSRSVHQTGQSPEGEITVGIVRPGHVETWQGRDLTSTNLVCFGSGSEFDGTSAASFLGLTVSAKISNLEAAAEAFSLDLPDWLRTSGSPREIGSTDVAGMVRAVAEKRFREAPAKLSEQDEDTILLNILLAANGSNRAAPSGPRKRSRALSRALDIMTTHEADNIRIGSICRDAGVSWRTLDRAFKERFGVGPKRYSLQLRLGRVRSELLTSDQHRTVSDAANAHGFWHMGDFAMEYSRLFGELPSTTASLKWDA